MNGSWVCGELVRDRLRLCDPDGSELNERGGSARAVVVSRLDCDVRCIEAPAAAASELDALVRYRVRALYPGNLDVAVVDYVAQRKGRRLVVLVAIMASQTLAKYREAAGAARLVTMGQLLYSADARFRDATVLHVAERHFEILRIEDGLIVDSTLVKRTRLSTDLAKARRLMSDTEPAKALQIVARAAEIESIRENLEAGASPAFIELTAAESLEPRLSTVEPLFREQPSRLRISATMLRVALLALVLGLAVGLFYRIVDLRAAELAEYRSVLTGADQLAARSAERAAQAAALQKQLDALAASRPIDTYAFLSDLTSVLGSSVVVSDLVMRDGVFQLQAEGSDPLAVMERFAGEPHFKKVRLLQTRPVGGAGREEFTLTGGYR